MSEGAEGPVNRPTIPRFDTVRTHDRQISLVKPLPNDIPPEFPGQFTKLLSTASPRDLPGEVIKEPNDVDRLIKRLDVGNIPVMVKGSRMTAESLIGRGSNERAQYAQWGGSIVEQFRKVGIVKERYREKYGEELNVEEALGYVIETPYTAGIIDRDINYYQRYIVYRYYNQAEVPTDEVGKALYEDAVNKTKGQMQKLKDLEDERFEANDIMRDGGQFIITGDSQSGYRGILVDTELWRVR